MHCGTHAAEALLRSPEGRRAHARRGLEPWAASSADARPTTIGHAGARSATRPQRSPGRCSRSGRRTRQVALGAGWRGGREGAGRVRGRLLMRGRSLAPGAPPIGRRGRCGPRGVGCRGAGGGGSGVAARSRPPSPRTVAGGIMYPVVVGAVVRVVCGVQCVRVRSRASACVRLRPRTPAGCLPPCTTAAAVHVRAQSRHGAPLHTQRRRLIQ